jgi:hypothetical protein
MKPNLCCILNPFLICNACKGIWCSECWFPISSTNPEMPHPYTLDYHQGSRRFRRLCKASNLIVEYIAQEAPAMIEFKILGGR